MCLTSNFSSVGLVHYHSCTRCLCSDMFHIEHEFFSYLIKKKNRLRSKKSVQNGQIRDALQGYKLATTWRINVLFPVLLCPSPVEIISWVQAQDYVKGGRMSRDRDQLIVECVDRKWTLENRTIQSDGLLKQRNAEIYLTLWMILQHLALLHATVQYCCVFCFVLFCFVFLFTIFLATTSYNFTDS